MDKNQQDKVKENLNLRKINVDLIVHIVRIAVKLGLVGALIYSKNAYVYPLSAYVIGSELFDQTFLYLRKWKPGLIKVIPVIYIFNSVLMISTILYFANWVQNDAYLIYIIHISSTTIAYGYKYGLLSFILSMLSYSGLMLNNRLPWEMYLRIPLSAVFIMRLIISQQKAEKTESAFDNLLEIEKSKQDFIALASHHLRTPVAAIYGYLDLLLRGSAKTGLTDSQKEYIEKIKSNNKELEKLTESLLQISIFEIGREINLFQQPTQIEVLVSDIVDQFQGVCDVKKIELRYIRSDQLLPLVNIDIEKMKATISNLVDNAIKYTEHGKVTVKTGLNGQFVEISVSDTGVGIPEEELPKVFNKFYRSGNVLVYNQVGTGLGLYLGKQIIQRHGGNIHLSSVKGEGTTFVVDLPIMKESA